MFDIGSALIVAMIFGIIILPIVIYNLLKKRKHSKFRKDFIKLAESEKVVISKKEIWNHCYAICIDEEAKKILYAIKRADKIDKTLIDLASVESCRIANLSKTIKNQDGKPNVSDRLELVIRPRNSGNPEQLLEFYDSKEFMPSPDDVSRAEKWLNIVTSNLK